MRISDLHLQDHADRRRLCARVSWEDNPRPPLDVFIEVPGEAAGDLSASPHALLPAAAVAAMRHGEKRLTLEGPVCPRLVHGLTVVGQLLQTWYGRPYQPIAIESARGLKAARPPAAPRAACFLSGGVDSLTTLRLNRLDLPADHPGSIRDGLCVHGFDLGGSPGETPRYELFDDLLAGLRELATDQNFTLIPIYTNLRHLDDDLDFWSHQFHGAALASTAHALSARLGSVLLASTAPCDVICHEFKGSHPLIDPSYSTAGLSVHHDGLHMTRLDKVRLLADWSFGLDRVRVCTNPHVPRGQVNCGKCEKCLRTMLHLTLVGRLADCGAFPHRQLTVAQLRQVDLKHEWQIKYYQPLIEPLRRAGRADLAQVIEEGIAEYHRYHRWQREEGLKGAMRRFDRRRLGGVLTRLVRAIR